jgi:23S rRNA pseudouridine2605 synthase
MSGETVRIQKFMAGCGVASRRKCEEYIAEGRVTVNGIAAEPGMSVRENDEVLFDGERVLSGGGDKIYIMLNKPARCVTSSKDGFGRLCAVDLVDCSKSFPGRGVRLFSVGRLDYDTTGLLLLTNDGDFAYKMTHPKHTVKKVYIARVKGVLSEYTRRLLCEGVDIGGDRKTAPAEVELLRGGENFTNVKITLIEGRNRQVKRMFEAAGHNVAWLKRVMVGGLELGNLEPGEWRELSEAEVGMLKNTRSETEWG